MKFIFFLIVIISSPSMACVKFGVDHDWDKADKVYLGKVISGKLITYKGYEYAQYRVSVTYKLKGKKVQSKEKAIIDTNFPTLSIGNSYVVFEQANGYVDYCGSTQVFDFEWLKDDYKIDEYDPEELIKRVSSIVGKKP